MWVAPSQAGVDEAVESSEDARPQPNAKHADAECEGVDIVGWTASVDRSFLDGEPLNSSYAVAHGPIA